LSELDPAGNSVYQQNLATFEAKLTAKDKEWMAKMAPYANVKVVTFHDSWPNFAKHFQLDVRGHIEPKPGIPPSPSHTLEIINLIIAEKIPVIIVEPYFDLKTPNYIGSKTGAKVLRFYPSVGGTPQIKDYFALFDTNIDTLVDALKQSR
jgi:ABC-type Zn uptake system ZnuABC Zn-binding protein ZnuA